MRESTLAEVRRSAKEAALEAVRVHEKLVTDVARETATEAAAAIARRVSDRIERNDASVRRIAAATAKGTFEKLLSGWQPDRSETEVRAAKVAETTAKELLRDCAGRMREVARDEAAKVCAEESPRIIQVDGHRPDPAEVSGDTHAVLPDLLLALRARCHVLLVGPAGTGKSTMAEQAAEAFGLAFHALSLGPTTPMSKVFGYFDAHGHYHDTPFRRAFEHGGLMLLDELDSGHPGLLAELNQALALGVCAFADGMVTAHRDFCLVATGNTYGTGGDRQYVGRQALDAATLDRFAVLEVQVDERLERRVALAQAPSRQAEAVRILEEVRGLRAAATEKRLPVMFSPRASIDAAKLLEAGATLAQARAWRVVRGISAAHREALGLDHPIE
ncbi:AAA family ATPase [Amycolatopsis sp. CA-230715]|uniref:AAA family ATPase n=1 Tax=Amycolatopsis sp. CA-230715 TaxID=2745196 RepID=UPI001C027E4B|nr:AAA family ATPase [Amycolatopsis sp. CA-230715]QWF82442.1 hypothetical protein HUW46_05879 [Amycolatopsis sp. CA-230715]